VTREVAGSKVRVSVLCPGPINTRIGQAERNRPGDKAAPTETEAERRFYAGFGPLLSAGMGPAAVAGLVVGGIRKNRFWTFTRPAWKQIVSKRAEALAANDDLYPRR
jgi:NAD(P)-dependent dehydrogenase (short-subunit alcohol dehydrogenase family)